MALWRCVLQSLLLWMNFRGKKPTKKQGCDTHMTLSFFWDRWLSFLDSLRDLEKLLGRSDMRDQFTSACVSNRADAAMFAHWNTHLRGLRWEVVAKFCQEDTGICFVHFTFLAPPPLLPVFQCVFSKHFMPLHRHLATICTELLVVEEPLRRCWDKNKYTKQSGSGTARKPLGVEPEYA